MERTELRWWWKRCLQAASQSEIPRTLCLNPQGEWAMGNDAEWSGNNCACLKNKVASYSSLVLSFLISSLAHFHEIVLSSSFLFASVVAPRRWDISAECLVQGSKGRRYSKRSWNQEHFQIFFFKWHLGVKFVSTSVFQSRLDLCDLFCARESSRSDLAIIHCCFLSEPCMATTWTSTGWPGWRVGN